MRVRWRDYCVHGNAVFLFTDDSAPGEFEAHLLIPSDSFGQDIRHQEPAAYVIPYPQSDGMSVFHQGPAAPGALARYVRGYPGYLDGRDLPVPVAVVAGLEVVFRPIRGGNERQETGRLSTHETQISNGVSAQEVAQCVVSYEIVEIRVPAFEARDIRSG